MAGDIYTRQKCHVCGGQLVHDQKRRGCFCSDHPQVAATRFVVRFPGGIYLNAQDYMEAEQELNRLRYEKGSLGKNFNPDNYKGSRPNSFYNLKEKYLLRKKNLASYSDIARYIDRAAGHFGLKSIRDINGAEIEDYLYNIEGISEKTRHNHMSQLRDFWRWCLKRGNIIALHEMPAFPEIDYELGRRKLTDWETQEQIITKVKEISEHVNPKIWFGIDMLATYTALRPDDLRRVYENSLDRSGILIIHNPTKKKNKFKTIRLIEDHAKLWAQLQKQFPAMPDMPFFRHTTGINRVQADTPFGDKYLYKWWMKACKEVGLEGVPLYPGTKHTTATETARLLGTDKARTASGLSNKAFDRYCDVENNDTFEIVTAIRKKKKKTATVIPMGKKGSK